MTEETEYAQYKLRMPVGLKRQIDEAAEASSRSISAEIIKRLEESFEDRQPAPVRYGPALLTEWRACMEMAAERSATLAVMLDKPDDAMTEADEKAVNEVLQQLDFLDRAISDIEANPGFPEAFRRVDQAELRQHLENIRTRKLGLSNPATARLLKRVTGK